MLKRILSSTLILAVMSSAAMAHTGLGYSHGLAQGFLHPVTGLDHVLAMVAIGIFAAVIGRRALWMVPGAFMAFMLAGGALAMAGVVVPFVETGIALSVIVLGAVVALRWQAEVAIAVLLAAFFAIFHGYAHGAEMPADAGAATYAAGFLASTALLHAAGLALGWGVSRHADARLARVGGAAVAVAGVGLLSGLI